uniref:Uncharacterized protein n=1 Tax=viral metagenome TaxID=1070528 RepID=A0A6C0CY65_9ZZZZ
MNDLNDIIKYKRKSNNLYNKYDPLLNTSLLLGKLDKESETFMSEKPNWNKLLNGYKKMYIFKYLNENNEMDDETKKDIIRNIYNSQLNKHYNIEYDSENNKIIDITIIKNN